MGKKVLLAGILAGVVMFAWQTVWHMVLQFGEIGFRNLPNEETLLPALRASIVHSGMYFFPWMENVKGMSKEQQNAAQQKWTEKYRTGPYGILVYAPLGGEFNMTPLMLRQAAFDIIAGLLAAYLLAQTSFAGFGGRWLFVLLLGLIPGLLVSLPYWNWYRFPRDYTLAEIGACVSTFAVAGLALAGMVKKPAGQ